MIKNVKIPRAEVHIKSRLSLDELASAISEKFLLGLKFGGKEFFLMNENPAVFIRPLFGMEIVLWHDLEEPELFRLDIDNYVSNDFNIWQFIDVNSIKGICISKLIQGMLILEGFDCFIFDDESECPNPAMDFC